MTNNTAGTVSFTNLEAARQDLDATQLLMRVLLQGDTSSFNMVSWPPNWQPQECYHDGFEEYALILEGSIVDAGKVHPAGTAWKRPPGERHHPRSGPEGAFLVLLRVQTP